MQNNSIKRSISKTNYRWEPRQCVLRVEFKYTDTTPSTSKENGCLFIDYRKKSIGESGSKSDKHRPVVKRKALKSHWFIYYGFMLLQYLGRMFFLKIRCLKNYIIEIVEEWRRWFARDEKRRLGQVMIYEGSCFVLVSNDTSCLN